MKFTSTSDVLLKLEKVNLVFSTNVYRSWTWREAFTRLTRSPTDLPSGGRERLPVARDISFSVRHGERVGILGVNGAGKTSLCRCIAGIYSPTSGTIQVSREIRAIFDTSTGIHPELTGRENAYLLAEFMYPHEPDMPAMVEEALEFSELGRFVDVPFRLYSNGMQARLCLSLISCRPCDLLILDEVFDGADTFFREKISNRVTQMIQQSGAALFVSHSMDQVKKVCNRVLILHQGNLLFDGSVDSGLERYRDLRNERTCPPPAPSERQETIPKQVP